MEYESGKKVKIKKISSVDKTKVLRWVVALLVAVIFIGAVLLFIPRTKTGLDGLVRIKNTIAYLLFSQTPHFYYLGVERNGKEERLTDRDIFA